MLSTALATEKNMCNSYAIAMPEASNAKFYSLLFDDDEKNISATSEIVILQFQHGWCSITPAEPSEIQLFIRGTPITNNN